jgi:hypothetical protein
LPVERIPAAEFVVIRQTVADFAMTSIPAGGADGAPPAKVELFSGGDPDRGEFPEFSDFAVLELPDRPSPRGLVRILCSISTGRYRLLMRDAVRPAALLNHFLLPPYALTAASDRCVTYAANDTRTRRAGDR